MADNTLKSKLSAYFTSRNDISFAYLFGSAARGETTTESDVDIAVYLQDCDSHDVGTAQERISPSEIAIKHQLPDIEELDYRFPEEDELWAEVEKICKTQVDLVVLNRAAASIAAGAMLTGSLLHSRNEYLRMSFFLSVTSLVEEQSDFVGDYVQIKARSRSLSKIDRARLMRIIDFLEDELQDAERFSILNNKLYSTDRDFRRLVERWVENLINASIDIAKIVLASKRRPIPQTYRETVEMLATVDGFHQLKDEIRSMAGHTRVRNILAHEYLDLRYTRIDAVVTHAAETYGALVIALRKWLA